MSRKHFSLLLFVTFVVAFAVLMIPGKTAREAGFERGRLLPDLESKVNEVSWLRISGAGDTTIATLLRQQGQWVVREVSDYRADWDQLKGLLSDLARAEVVEPKTSNPDYYDRLGVEDTAREGAGGVRIDFAPETGLSSVIIGNPAQQREGQYARLVDAAESALIDRGILLARETSGWLDTEIVDIADSEVVEYEISHADGERVLARKVSVEDENFELQDVPEGREPKSEWTVNSVANSLAALALDDVKPASELEWANVPQFRLLTVGGLQLSLDLLLLDSDDAESSADDEHWVRVEAGTYTTGLGSGVEPEDDPEQRADAINQRVRGWAYRIPKYKFDAMIKRMEDMLKAPES
jgi:hypothetical protein